MTEAGARAPAGMPTAAVPVGMPPDQPPVTVAAAPALGGSRRRGLPVPTSTLLRHAGLALLAGVVLYFVTIRVTDFTDGQRITSIAYTLIAVAGLSVLVGHNGQVSLGHGALMMVGAYTVGLMLLHEPGTPVWVDVLLAVVVTMAVGAPVGVAAARLRGPYLAGATLAFAVGLPAVASKYSTQLGGVNGLGFSSGAAPGQLRLDVWHAWMTCLAALITLVLLANLGRSRVGRNWRAVRDDEIAAALAGIHVARTQVLAFVVSAACAGLGGGLLAFATGIAAPGAFQFTLSVALLTAAIIGGLGSLAGAGWGSLLLVYLPVWSRDVADHFKLSINVQNNLPLAAYGVVLVLTILLFPGGIHGALRAPARLARRARHVTPAPARPSASADRSDFPAIRTR